jgi:hypothetical protein
MFVMALATTAKNTDKDLTFLLCGLRQSKSNHFKLLRLYSGLTNQGLGYICHTDQGLSLLKSSF